MRKGDNGEKKTGKKEIMMKIVATNIVASRPPERRPTAMPTACAKMGNKAISAFKSVDVEVEAELCNVRIFVETQFSSVELDLIVVFMSHLKSS